MGLENDGEFFVRVDLACSRNRGGHLLRVVSVVVVDRRGTCRALSNIVTDVAFVFKPARRAKKVLERAADKRLLDTDGRGGGFGRRGVLPVVQAWLSHAT